MLIKGWYLLYPNNDKGASYSTNYFEMGIHSQIEGELLHYPDELKEHDRWFTVPLAQSPPCNLTALVKNSNIPVVNVYHQLVAGTKNLGMSREDRERIFPFF